MDMHEIVKKLIGPIEPVGETNADNDRFENLKVMTALVEELLVDIDHIAPNQHRVEYSRKRAGEHVRNFFDDIGIDE